MKDLENNDKIIKSSASIVIYREQVESFYKKSLAQIDG
jgi:hypothetical protein